MRYQIYRILFIIFLFAEVLLLTGQRMRYLGYRENAIVIILMGAGLGIFALLASFQSVPTNEKKGGIPWENRILKIVAGIGILLSLFHFGRQLSNQPVNVHVSDILPTIQTMNQRLLDGQYPYALIQDFGYDLSPTYLPLMWMPFLPATALHLDERWIAWMIWMLASILLIRRVHQSNFSIEVKWLLTTLPFFYFILFGETTVAIYASTVEIMIAGFYMLFALQLDQIRIYFTGNPLKKGAILGFFIALCLLSRYSFLLWLPFGFLVVWSENKKLAWYTAAWASAWVLVLFVLPFLSQDPMVYFNGLKHYSSAALAIWSQTVHVSPLNDGIGIAGIFRENMGGEMADRLAALQKTQMILSLVVVGICALIWWRKRSQIRHLPLYLLGSLKLYFAIFYGFIQTPYVYLMLTPCFLSLVMLMTIYRTAENEVSNYPPTTA